MATSAPDDRVIAVDLGKTSLRAALFVGGESVEEVRAEGAPGLGLERSADAVLVLLNRALAPLIVPRPTHVGVGVAGALASPDEAQRLAVLLADRLRARAAVTSDLIAAHVGAFAGGPGVLLIAGTGAVGLGVDADGKVMRADGWGPDIGDLGSGSWIGREVVRAVLLSREQNESRTLLDGMLKLVIPGGHEPIRWIAHGPNPARRLAAFAPLAIEAAEKGDAVAAQIVAAAVRHLTRTALRAGGGDLPVAAIGGLTESPFFRQALADAKAFPRPVAPLGSPLAGAYAIATRTGYLHEAHIHRAG